MLPEEDVVRKEQDLSLPMLENQSNAAQNTKISDFRSLGLLDRFLAVWILLAMVIGIILGNFVSSTGPALQKGKFVGVSVPIGNITFQVYSPFFR